MDGAFHGGLMDPVHGHGQQPGGADRGDEHENLTREFQQLLSRVRRHDTATATAAAGTAPAPAPSAALPTEPSRLLLRRSDSTDSLPPEPRRRAPPAPQPVRPAAGIGGGQPPRRRAPPSGGTSNSGSKGGDGGNVSGYQEEGEGTSHVAHLQARLAAAEARCAEERGTRLALAAQMAVEGPSVRQIFSRVKINLGDIGLTGFFSVGLGGFNSFFYMDMQPRTRVRRRGGCRRWRRRSGPRRRRRRGRRGSGRRWWSVSQLLDVCVCTCGFKSPCHMHTD